MTIITTAKGPDGSKTPVAIFPDFEHMSDYLKSKKPLGYGYKYSITRKALATGDAKLAAKAETLLASIETESLYSDSVSQWGRSVSGALPDVPAYLAGVPTNMRRRTPQQGLAPLTVVVETFMSGGVTDECRERRSVAILALVRKLAMTGHAVDLWLAHTSRPGETATCLVRVESQPLDLARAVWGFAASFDYGGFKMASAEVLYNLRGREAALQPPFRDRDFPNNPAKQHAYYSPILNSANALLAIPSLCGETSDDFASTAAAQAWLARNYAQASELARQQLD